MVNSLTNWIVCIWLGANCIQGDINLDFSCIPFQENVAFVIANAFFRKQSTHALTDRELSQEEIQVETDQNLEHYILYVKILWQIFIASWLKKFALKCKHILSDQLSLSMKYSILN